MSKWKMISILVVGIAFVCAAIAVISRSTAPDSSDHVESLLSSEAVAVDDAKAGSSNAAKAPSPIPEDAVSDLGDKEKQHPTARRDETVQDEASLMGKLRELKGDDPPLSLALAREGNARYPDSPDAPERTWFLIRALSDMRRHDEARAEARAMVDKDPDNHWARDVRRHMLIHPPGPPPPRDESAAK